MCPDFFCNSFHNNKIVLFAKICCVLSFGVSYNFRSVHCCVNAEKYLMIELDSEFCNVNQNDGI